MAWRLRPTAHAMCASINWARVAVVSILTGAVCSIAVEAGAEHATRRAHRVRGQLVIRAKAGAPAGVIERALARAGVDSRRRMRVTRGDVITVAPRDLARVERELRLSGLFKSVERDYLAAVATAPDDPYYSAQWGLPRSGVPVAWALSTGDAAAPVAVLDTGVDGSHPDLTGQLLPGYDFINGDSDPSDDHGHGTRMSGIVSAVWNNAEGIAGVAPNAPILPVKVLGADGTGPYSAIADGITWAADHGARVISLSLAGPNPSQILQDAVNYARANGAVCVAAAGNDGSDVPVYPAATSGVVAVAAIDEGDRHAWFSNTGAWISHSAPGVSVLTTDLGGGYAPSTGTSPAAAFSSGVFALLLAFAPDLTPQNAVARVEQGAFDLGSAGWDSTFGWGGIDAMAALVPGEPGAAPPDATAPTVALLSPVRGSLVSGTFSVEVAASDNVGISRVELFVDNRKYSQETQAPYSFIVDAATLLPGKHKLRAYAFDAAGNRKNTKNVQVFSTTGVGLLVKKAKVAGDKIQINASFALPEGVVFDAESDSITVVLESDGSNVLTAVANPWDLEVSGSKTTATVGAVVPAAAVVNLKTSGKGPAPQIYSLKIQARHLDGMAPVSDTLVVTVALGDVLLSQPITLRSKGTNRLVYP
jgi:subtilisin family serine protease